MQIAIGRCTGLGMAHLTLRLDDEMLYAVDALARAAGMTRSRWIARAIIDALPARPEEVRDVPIGEGASKLVSPRFPLEELAAMEFVASRRGLTRAPWVQRTLRWQLLPRAGEFRPVPGSHRELIRLVRQVHTPGRSLNQPTQPQNA